MTKVSVLIAVYNAEKHLHECLDSLLGHTLTDFEAICVDDASTDSSAKILSAYAEQDKRIKVISLSRNSGQAKARNTALAVAKGEYICMLDSDDWFSADALESAVSVYERFPNTDSVLFTLTMCYGEKHENYPQPQFDMMTGAEAFEASLTWKVHGLYMVRSEIHKSFPYDDSSHAYSDDNTTRIHFIQSREVRPCTGIYYYRQHADSVTHKINVHRFDYLAANQSMKRQMLDMGVSQDLISLYENARWINVIGVYMFYFFHRGQLDKSARQHGLAEIKQAWGSIETHRLEKRNKRKFGYMPLRCSWVFFRLQEELYFTLRRLIRGR